jgi:hypothetical protein
MAETMISAHLPLAHSGLETTGLDRRPGHRCAVGRVKGISNHAEMLEGPFEYLSARRAVGS